MPKLLETRQLSAELAAVDRLLAQMPQDDILGRLGLKSRRDEIAAQLERANRGRDMAASVALMFGGRPVIGSIGIETSFATDAVAKFQDLVTNIWGTSEGAEIGARGPVPDQERSRLHITSLLHGSVGFLIEELDPDERLFESPLKKAADRATDVIAAFASDDEDRFSSLLETVDQRVLGSTREFLKQIYRAGATLRLIEGNRELDLPSERVGRAYQRAESAAIEESEGEIKGILLGLIPMGRRFELKDDSGAIISGTVAPTLSESYLQKLEQEELVGKRCKGRVRKRTIRRFGKTSESVLLLDIVGNELT